MHSHQRVFASCLSFPWFPASHCPILRTAESGRSVGSRCNRKWNRNCIWWGTNRDWDQFPLGHKPTATAHAPFSLWLRQPQWPPLLLFVALCALISNTFAIDVHKWPLGAVNRKCHQFRTIWSVEQGVEGFGKLEVNIKDKRFIQALRPSTDLFSLPSLVNWMRWNWVKMAKVTLIPRAKSQVWSTNHFHKLWLN